MTKFENQIFKSLLIILFSIPVLSIMTEAESRLPVLRLIAGGRSFEVEIAATSSIRNKGLMYRSSLPANHGMLFVFPEKEIHCMWMRNTNIPLSVAFIDEQGTIVNIEDMKPHTDEHHCAERPVRYAIEMQSGWFQENGIVSGMRIKGLKTGLCQYCQSNARAIGGTDRKLQRRGAGDCGRACGVVIETD